MRALPNTNTVFAKHSGAVGSDRMLDSQRTHTDLAMFGGLQALRLQSLSLCLGIVPFNHRFACEHSRTPASLVADPADGFLARTSTRQTRWRRSSASSARRRALTCLT